MNDMIQNLNIFAKKVMGIKSGKNLLIIADNYARPRLIGEIVMELAGALGSKAILVVMEPLTQTGDEPPKLIADAMKQVDIVFQIVEKFDICHTNARKEASEAGTRFFVTYTEISEDYFKRKISFTDLKAIGERTDKLTRMFTKASKARLTTPFGTDLTMDIKGRQGLAVHPLGNAGIVPIPDYAEVLICPREGTTEGVAVVDGSVQGWGYVPKEPIRFSVKKGRVKEVMGHTEDARKLRKLISTDKNANNCVGELAIGTSHTVSRNLLGGVWDYAILGAVHIAVGRNNDIGGATWSRVHNDLLMTKPTLELDGVRILENGNLRL